MNFVSTNTLFAVYPVLIAVKCGILNPILFAYGNTKIPSLDAAFKYINRGYLLQSSIQSCMTDLEIDEDKHICGYCILYYVWKPKEMVMIMNVCGCLSPVLQNWEEFTAIKHIPPHKFSKDWMVAGAFYLYVGYNMLYVQKLCVAKLGWFLYIIHSSSISTLCCCGSRGAWRAIEFHLSTRCHK